MLIIIIIITIICLFVCLLCEFAQDEETKKKRMVTPPTRGKRGNTYDKLDLERAGMMRAKNRFSLPCDCVSYIHTYIQGTTRPVCAV